MRIAVFLLGCLPLLGQTLDDAYAALRSRDYERAIAIFERNLTTAAVRKDLAYTYLKVGETEAARDQFAEVMRLDPADHHAALEFAFLAHETRQQAEARRVFDRIRRTGDAASKATAEQAFENIDRPLREGLDRWSKAAEANPNDFSGHHELARLAEQRDDLDLAVSHYRQAWRLKSEMRSLLVDLGRVLKRMDKGDESTAALLAASRGAEPHTAEQARTLLPARYPYVYEFLLALEIDPPNIELRRELAYLLLKMDNNQDAEEQFRVVVDKAPDDLVSVAQLGFLRLARNDTAGAMPLLERVLKNGDGELADRVRSALRLPQTFKRRPETPRSKISNEAKLLADRSFEAGYLKDALKYLKVAHESDPVDFAVMLKLGWTHNMLKEDDAAWQWFSLARQAPSSEIAVPADQAWKNLKPEIQRVRTSAWLFPFFSSRWHDVFAYGQIKTEFRFGRFPIRPYASLRFVGDTRGGIGDVAPQYLSENALIAGVGLATPSAHGVSAWIEAGTAFSYLGRRRDMPTAVSDYRGGLSFGRGWGRLLRAESSGFFFETNADGVYISRFDNDVLLYSQNRTGFTWRHTQLFWNYNGTVDLKRQYWANFAETGPGARIPVGKSLYFQLGVLRGVYLINRDNPRRPNFWDLRAGLWYAISK